MPLDLPASARYARSGTEQSLPDEFVAEAYRLLLRIVGAATRDRQPTLEHFKQFFYLAGGRAHHWSSSSDFAEFDLRESMRVAKTTPALFLEALYDGIETLRAEGKHHLPDLQLLNEMLRSHGVPYEIAPPKLIKLAAGQGVVRPPELPASVSDRAAALLSASLTRAEDLLAENRPREAVQEILWMLESFVTTFRGATLPAGQVSGKYFNEIAKELRAGTTSTTFERVLDWLNQLHGYLSSPTGGGVRHGLDLHSGTEISAAEGRLFVNLVLSYLSYLLSEHHRLTSTGV